MDLTQHIDGYCERLDPSYWAEPVNAITNAAFLVAALVMWLRTAGMPMGRLLSLILAAIGVGSFLFHTHATVWASIADVTPIVLFILTYVYAANRDFWGWRVWVSGLGATFFLPYAAAATFLFAELPFFVISAPYWPVALLILVYAWLLPDPLVSRGLAIGAGLLILSLTARSLDLLLCPTIPLGTHWIWHCLNGLMLGWMIEVWRQKKLRLGKTSEPR